MYQYRFDIAFGSPMGDAELRTVRDTLESLLTHGLGGAPSIDDLDSQRLQVHVASRQEIGELEALQMRRALIDAMKGDGLEAHVGELVMQPSHIIELSR